MRKTCDGLAGAATNKAFKKALKKPNGDSAVTRESEALTS